MPRFSRFILACLLLAGISSAGAAESYPPVIQNLVTKQGARIFDRFDTAGGLTAYGAQINGRSMILYMTPDGKHFVVGALFDEKGVDLTPEQVTKHVTTPMLKGAWDKLEKATWFAEGPKHARTTIYVVDDPNCPFCHLYWLANRPYVKKGLQIRHIMVGFLTPSSRNKAAAILQSKDPAAAYYQNEHDYRTSGSEDNAGAITPLKDPKKETLAKLDANYQLMRDLGVRGTPGIFIKDRNGKVVRVDGLPKLSELSKLYGLPAQPITDPLLQRWK